MSLDDSGQLRNECKHEYNFFLDKEIQKRLLAADEDKTDQDDAFQACFPSWSSGSKAKTLHQETLPWCWWEAGHHGWTSSRRCGDDRVSQHQHHQSKSKDNKADGARFDFTRNAKPRDIAYRFEHWDDRASHIEQYRLQYTLLNFDTASPCGQDLPRLSPSSTPATHTSYPEAKTVTPVFKSSAILHRTQTVPALIAAGDNFASFSLSKARSGSDPSMLEADETCENPSSWIATSPINKRKQSNDKRTGSSQSEGKLTRSKTTASSASAIVAPPPPTSLPHPFARRNTSDVDLTTPIAGLKGAKKVWMSDSKPSLQPLVVGCGTWNPRSSGSIIPTGTGTGSGGSNKPDNSRCGAGNLATAFSGKTMKHVPANGYPIDDQTTSRRQLRRKLSKKLSSLLLLNNGLKPSVVLNNINHCSLDSLQLSEFEVAQIRLPIWSSEMLVRDQSPTIVRGLGVLPAK